MCVRTVDRLLPAFFVRRCILPSQGSDMAVELHELEARLNDLRDSL